MQLASLNAPQLSKEPDRGSQADFPVSTSLSFAVWVTNLPHAANVSGESATLNCFDREIDGLRCPFLFTCQRRQRDCMCDYEDVTFEETQDISDCFNRSLISH